MARNVSTIEFVENQAWKVEMIKDNEVIHLFSVLVTNQYGETTQHFVLAPNMEGAGDQARCIAGHQQGCRLREYDNWESFAKQIPVGVRGWGSSQF